MIQLVRRHLVQSGQLFEPLVRRAAAGLAELLAGGDDGYSWDYGEAAGHGHDPHGYFELVTEGRQCRWKNPDGKWRAYSACEDLHGAVYLRLCGCPPTPAELAPVLKWCNRREAGREWIEGHNLLLLKKRLPDAWRRYRSATEWDVGPGDAVQIRGKCEHTFVVLDVRYEHGRPVEIDHADYGQFHQPEGASRRDHSCRCYRGAGIAQVNGQWCVNGKPIIGRASVWDVVQYVHAHPAAGYALPAWVPEGFEGGLEADNPHLPKRKP